MTEHQAGNPWDNSEDRVKTAKDLSTPATVLIELWRSLKMIPVVNEFDGIKDAVNWTEGSDNEARYFLGRHPNLSVGVVREIVALREPNSVFGVTENKNAPADVLLSLRSWNGNEVIKRNVVDNPSAPDTVRTVYVGDSYFVKDLIAASNLTSVSVLTELSTDEHWAVVKSVAANPNTPLDVLTSLVSHPDHRVKWSLSQNSAVPTEIAVQAFLESKSKIATRIVEEVPSRVLVKLLEESYPGVSESMPREWLFDLWMNNKGTTKSESSI